MSGHVKNAASSDHTHGAVYGKRTPVKADKSGFGHSLCECQEAVADGLAANMKHTVSQKGYLGHQQL